MAGTWVLFSWNAANAVKTVFLGEDKAPVDTRVLQINTPTTYVFSAINAQNSQVDLFIQILTTPRSPPTPPFNVTGVFTGTTTGPITLSWNYSDSQLYLIDSFKIYRSQVPSTTFIAVANNISKATLPYRWVDTAGGCNFAYYVVAVYTDSNQVQKETGPSTNSWYSPACPP